VATVRRKLYGVIQRRCSCSASASRSDDRILLSASRPPSRFVKTGQAINQAFGLDQNRQNPFGTNSGKPPGPTVTTQPDDPLRALGVYDSRGVLEPSQLGLNASRTPEYIFTRQGWDSMRSTASNPTAVGATYNVYGTASDDMIRQLRINERRDMMHVRGPTIKRPHLGTHVPFFGREFGSLAKFGPGRGPHGSGGLCMVLGLLPPFDVASVFLFHRPPMRFPCRAMHSGLIGDWGQATYLRRYSASI